MFIAYSLSFAVLLKPFDCFLTNQVALLNRLFGIKRDITYWDHNRCRTKYGLFNCFIGPHYFKLAGKTQPFRRDVLIIVLKKMTLIAFVKVSQFYSIKLVLGSEETYYSCLVTYHFAFILQKNIIENIQELVGHCVSQGSTGRRSSGITRQMVLIVVAAAGILIWC